MSTGLNIPIAGKVYADSVTFSPTTIPGATTPNKHVLGYNGAYLSYWSGSPLSPMTVGAGETVGTWSSNGVFTSKGTIGTFTYYTVATSPGTGGTMSGGGKFESGSSCTITATPSSGYVLESLDGTYESQYSTAAKNTTFQVLTDKTVYATFLPYYRIRFQPNGSNVSNMPSTVSPCVLNATYQLPNKIPTRSGYEFLGWATSQSNANAGIVAYQPGDNFSRSASISAGQYVDLYAAWKQYTLTYNSNGGTPTPSAQNYFGNITLAAAPEKSGRIFDGWLIGETKYSAGDTYLLEEDATAVAQWRGFDMSATRSSATLAGTLSLVNTATGVTVATESNGTLSYTGEVGATYRIVCTVGTGADAYTMPAGISGLTNDTFTPESGQTYSFEYSCPFYWVSLPAADSHGNVLGITKPSTYDAQITVNNATLPAYASGRSVTITATTDSEYSLESAIFRGEDGASFATRSNITNDKFTEPINRSFSVEPTYGQKHYSVSIAKDAPSKSAFSSFSADASYAVADTPVTFSATVAAGFSFEGFYLNGTKVDSADITESGDTYSFTHTVVEATAVVVKAKVSVKLSLSDSTLASLAITYGEDSQTPGTAFYVTLGDSFSYEVSVTAAYKYFNGWYNADDVSHENPRSGFGDSKTVTPDAALDIYALIGDIDPSAPVTVTFAYANGTDATEGSFSVDGVPGPQVKTLSYDETVEPSVTLATFPENGFEFAGWFANPDGMGDPIAVGGGGVLVVSYSRTIYALFVQNDHAICEWEGAETPKPMTWRSKTYESSKPFNPSACRVDARGYAGDGKGTVLELTVDMFSAPDAAATATARLTNIANQDARRLPVRRMERYMQIEVKCNREVDALLVGTAMEELAT